MTTPFSKKAMLPRSRLYCLPPIGSDTPQVESLTSYINRLAWSYRIGPRLLVAQEILPNLTGSHHLRLSPRQLGGFARSEAMSINGGGDVATDWAASLNQLTLRTDLQAMTVNWWAKELPTLGLLRATPAWCPDCYQEWSEREQPIYQPLVWMLQIMIVCPRHKRYLEEECPNCNKRQTVIATRTSPGYCTQCKIWLGTSNISDEPKIDDQIFKWQSWVLGIIDELRKFSINERLSWNRLPHALTICTELIGKASMIARMVDVPDSLLSRWINGKRTPSFDRVLELCYVLNISPVQLLSSDQETIQAILLNNDRNLPPNPKRKAPAKVDRSAALALIQAVLDGREEPLAIDQITRRLGLGSRTLVDLFPKECALVTAQYQAYRAERAKLRVARIRNMVREAALAVYAKGTYPSGPAVAALLPDRNMLRTAEGLDTLHAVRRELGIEPE